MIARDFERLYEGTKGSTAIRIISCMRSPGFQGVLCYRLRRWLLERNVVVKLLLKPFALYFDHRMKAKWGIEIQTRAVIGEGFRVRHYGGIFIGGGTVVGKNFSIAHDITIGTGANEGTPTIGDNVTVNTGAVIHGKITVGNNVHIGPNAVVNKSIPDDALVHPVAAQVVRFPRLYAAPPPPSEDTRA
jgi:serine O-acetyltransferase